MPARINSKQKKPKYFKKIPSVKDREIFGKKGKEKFPRITRTITDPFDKLRVNLPGRILWIESLLILKSRFLISLMISLVILALIVVFGMEIYRNLQNEKELKLNREKIASEIKYWQQVVGKYKNYRDAYFQLSILEYKTGDKEKARDYLQRVLELDPNFEAAKKIESLL